MKQLISDKQNSVLVFGVFDKLHPGHREFLKQARNRAKKLDAKLVVVIAPDKAVWEIKHRMPHYTDKSRASRIRRLAYVDEVVLGDEIQGRHSAILAYKPVLIALGYDQKGFDEHLRAWMAVNGLNIKLERLEAFEPERYKSSKM